MKFKYDVIFIPNGVDPLKVKDTRSTSMTVESRLDSKDLLREEARKNAIYKRHIDQYAVRKYWYVACCEMTLMNSPWDGTKELSEYMRSEYDVKSIPRVQNTWRHESIECSFDSAKAREDVQEDLRKKFNDKLPMASRRTNMRITLRAKANVSLEDFQKAKEIFEKHQDQDS